MPQTHVDRTKVIEDLSASSLVVHFFYRHSDSANLDARALFRAYIPQMIAYLDSQDTACPSNVQSALTRFFGQNSRNPSFNEVFRECFLPLHCFVVAQGIRIFYVVDGLHECEGNEWPDVLRAFRDLLAIGNAKVMISGRESLAVSSYIPATSKVTISEADTRKDIRSFVSWNIYQTRQQPLTRDTELLEEVVEALNDRAHLM